MSQTLAQLSTCSQNVESLLASLAIVKNVTECNAEGNVPVGGTASEILKKLFGCVRQADASDVANSVPGAISEGNVISYDEMSAALPAGEWYGFDSDSSNADSSCFDELNVHYYDKNGCTTSSCPWDSTNDCVTCALHTLRGIDAASTAPTYTSLGFDSTATAAIQAAIGAFVMANMRNPTVEELKGFSEDEGDIIAFTTFKTIADIFANVLSRGASDANTNPATYELTIQIYTAFCELLKGRVQTVRKLGKLQYVVDGCDF